MRKRLQQMTMLGLLPGKEKDPAGRLAHAVSRSIIQLHSEGGDLRTLLVTIDKETENWFLLRVEMDEN